VLPQNARNWMELAVSGPDCSTWENEKIKFEMIMKENIESYLFYLRFFKMNVFFIFVYKQKGCFHLYLIKKLSKVASLLLSSGLKQIFQSLVHFNY
jgi:hypothetical protein